jgi:hypothetical protein
MLKFSTILAALVCVAWVGGQEQTFLGDPLLAHHSLEWRVEDYKYLSYDQMRQRLHQLAKLHPHLLRLETADKKFGIPHYV